MRVSECVLYLRCAVYLLRDTDTRHWSSKTLSSFLSPGTRGEHTESEGGVYDISNKRRMGLTEYQAVREMQDGIQELIKLEQAA